MGVDLRLLPFDADGGICYSHTMLACKRRRDLWDPIAKIEKAKGRHVPPGFTAYCSRLKNGELGYGKVIKDPYDSFVNFLLVEDLVSLREHEDVQDNHKNRAIWAYLAELPSDTKVALYWH